MAKAVVSPNSGANVFVLEDVNVFVLKDEFDLNVQDLVINVYLELLKERERRKLKKFLKCHFFNTFFYKKLVGENGYNYKVVKKWTSERKLGHFLIDCDKIFTKRKEVHWCLAVISKKDQNLQYPDLLKGKDAQVLNALVEHMDALLTLFGSRISRFCLLVLFGSFG